MRDEMTPLSFLEGFGAMFYIVSPNGTSFETIDEVPSYNMQAIPHFMLMFLAEAIYMKLLKKRTFRVNDAIVSVSQGMLQETVGLMLHGWRLLLYSYIYSNWRIITLPWNSLWTWWICFTVVDFLYYWVHRACHEINFLWAAHQVHHSSEDYNMSTALRQSATLNQLQWVFYLPMALAIPPSVYLVHNYLNLLYQFWIHTEAIKSIGPLEYILNTASHHRVHHGRNKYCIDKNYAGVLIIWDRMFGTFQEEKETVVYGLTHNVDSFNLAHLQLSHFKHIWKTFLEIKGWKNKMSVLVKGPGWSPGKPWHGNPEDIPEVKYPVVKYDPQLPLWRKAYAFWHTFLLVFVLYQVDNHQKELPLFIFYAFTVFMVFTMAVIGNFLENRSSSLVELLRCLTFLALKNYCTTHTTVEMFPSLFSLIFYSTYVASSVFWITYFFNDVKIT